ncbi:hypothetical protein N5C55_08765, partial [Pseudomonas otitidis]|uniref:hypothetical protein n=1 Tax=Metapseudomonas otitidis TaxID=319939 RepID=UPI002447B204
MSWWKRFLRTPHATPATDSDHDAAESPEATGGSIELRQGTAEYEHFITLAELEQGNLVHGAEHLAELLRYA